MRFGNLTEIKNDQLKNKNKFDQLNGSEYFIVGEYALRPSLSNTNHHNVRYLTAAKYDNDKEEHLLYPEKYNLEAEGIALAELPSFCIPWDSSLAITKFVSPELALKKVQNIKGFIFTIDSSSFYKHDYVGLLHNENLISKLFNHDLGKAFASSIFVVINNDRNSNDSKKVMATMLDFLQSALSYFDKSIVRMQTTTFRNESLLKHYKKAKYFWQKVLELQATHFYFLNSTDSGQSREAILKGLAQLKPCQYLDLNFKKLNNQIAREMSEATRIDTSQFLNEIEDKLIGDIKSSIPAP